jgi:hypothetical protein
VRDKRYLAVRDPIAGGTARIKLQPQGTDLIMRMRWRSRQPVDTMREPLQLVVVSQPGNRLGTDASRTRLGSSDHAPLSGRDPREHSDLGSTHALAISIRKNFDAILRS